MLLQHTSLRSCYYVYLFINRKLYLDIFLGNGGAVKRKGERAGEGRGAGLCSCSKQD